VDASRMSANVIVVTNADLNAEQHRVAALRSLKSMSFD